MTTFGGLVAGFFVGKGWFTPEQVTSFLTSEVVIGLIAAVVGGVWGLTTHTSKNAVTIVKNMDEVAGVITQRTPDGKALAASLPGTDVVQAGTREAENIAK